MRRGVFLTHGSQPEVSGPGRVFFVLNNDAGRRTLDRMKQSGEEPGSAAGFGADEAPARLQERPNIFALYEDTIGMLTPIVAERLKEAEDRYPPGWVRQAFEIAALENKRNWNYIAAILARWGSAGKEDWKDSNDDGKSGRNSAQNQRGKYREDYERYRGRSKSRTRAR